MLVAICLFVFIYLHTCLVFDGTGIEPRLHAC